MNLTTHEATPLCAFPLFGNNMDVIIPIEKVLLMFSTTPVNTGTVIEQSYGSGLLIDLTAENHRSVGYDINKGWSWGGYSWAQSVPPSAELVPLLIEPPPFVPRAGPRVAQSLTHITGPACLGRAAPRSARGTASTIRK